MKKFILTFICLFVLGAGLSFIKASQIMTMINVGATMQPPPEVVNTFTVEQQNWQNRLKSVGSLEAVRGVTLTADLSGRIEQILFKSGTEIEKGEILVVQNIASEQAQLKSAEANVALAKSELARNKDLLTKKLISQAEFDATEASYKSAQADAENIRVQIDKKYIKAPFSGRLGIRRVNLGQDINEGQAIVTLQNANPMLVNFNLPQKNLAQITLGLSVAVTTNSQPDQQFTGVITAINSEVDPITRNLLVQAELDNSESLLAPGMFVEVAVLLDTQQSVIVVPITAINYATYGDSVYVLEATEGEGNFIARQQFVQLGQSRGDFVVINKGLTPGQVVASSGLFKLRNGITINIRNDVTPTYQLDPQPQDR
ncbi:MAG: efflux RND transporter periplasmic adaptor subunit [Pseudomonadota bacterium]